MTKKRNQKKDRLGVVRDLWSGKYSMKVVRAKKGKGSYQRKAKNRAAEKRLFEYVN